MLRGTCDKSRLLDLLENFTVFSEHKTGLAKILGQNHQVLGVNAAIASLHRIRPLQPFAIVTGATSDQVGSGLPFEGRQFFAAEKRIVARLISYANLISALPRPRSMITMARKMSDTSSITSPRVDGRMPDQLRPVRFQNHIAPHATGSTLIEWGETRVICGVTVEESVPRWMKEQNVTGGWITAEYSMLPYSTLQRKQRDISKGKIDGRSQEIQRLIGRSIRAAVDLEKLGARTIWIDCDVLQADGGTRTAAITGAYVALALAMQKLLTEGKLKVNPLLNAVAAVSVGVVNGQLLLDLCYTEDVGAQVDMNIVMTSKGEFIEVQGSGEEASFTQEQLTEMISLGKKGVRDLLESQAAALGVAVMQ